MEITETVNQNGFDYTHQAWVVESCYIRCGHPEAMNCKCYGKIHEGEPVDPEAEIY